jgi:hypothetical protein
VDLELKDCFQTAGKPNTLLIFSVIFLIGILLSRRGIFLVFALITSFSALFLYSRFFSQKQNLIKDDIDSDEGEELDTFFKNKLDVLIEDVEEDEEDEDEDEEDPVTKQHQSPQNQPKSKTEQKNVETEESVEQKEAREKREKEEEQQTILKTQYDDANRLASKLIQGNAFLRAAEKLTEALELAKSVPSAAKDVLTLYNNR